MKKFLKNNFDFDKLTDEKKITFSKTLADVFQSTFCNFKRPILHQSDKTSLR